MTPSARVTTIAVLITRKRVRVGEGKGLIISAQIGHFPSDHSAVDCQISGWSGWTECRPDQGGCGIGTMERRRTVIRERENAGRECPALEERVGCFRQCASNGAARPESPLLPKGIFEFKEETRKESDGESIN